MVSYLLALGLTFFFPLLSERFSVCLSFVYLETMFGSHRSWLARYIFALHSKKWLVIKIALICGAVTKQIAVLHMNFCFIVMIRNCQICFILNSA